MRPFYLECGVVWRLYGQEIECQGHIPKQIKYLKMQLPR